MHECYKPENAGRLKELRTLEALQREGRLRKPGFHRMLELKRQLKIGIPQ